MYPAVEFRCGKSPIAGNDLGGQAVALRIGSADVSAMRKLMEIQRCPNNSNVYSRFKHF